MMAYAVLVVWYYVFLLFRLRQYHVNLIEHVECMAYEDAFRGDDG